MARYTLKVMFGDRQIERYDRRSPYHLLKVLARPDYHRAGETGPFGEIQNNPDHFEVFDSRMEKVFNGNIDEAISFVRAAQ